MATTTTYSFEKPTVGADDGTWGGKLNGNWDDVDDLLDGTTPVDGIDIDGGTIDGTVIGGTTRAAGSFSTAAVTANIIMGSADAWTFAGNWRGMKISDRHAIQATNAAGSVALSSNAAIGASGWEYTVSSAVATRYNLSTGIHTWDRAATGTDGDAVTWINQMELNASGDLSVTGALSKGSGSFKIDHPLKPDTHHLVHSFIEGPQADNIYRGVVTLSSGAATVNLDTAARMSNGTFAALNANVQCFTTNESGWTAVKGTVSGNTLTIEAEDSASTDTVAWLVIGERQDQHMIDTEWTDGTGRVITEPEKV